MADGDIIRDFYGAALEVRFPGQFEDETTHKIIEYGQSIKIKVGQMSLKISALQLAGLLHATQDPEVKAELGRRFKEEKQQLESLEGF